MEHWRPRNLVREEAAEVGYNEIGTVAAQPLGGLGRADPNDEPETSGPPGGDSGQGVFDDDRALWGHPE